MSMIRHGSRVRISSLGAGLRVRGLGLCQPTAVPRALEGEPQLRRRIYEIGNVGLLEIRPRVHPLKGIINANTPSGICQQITLGGIFRCRSLFVALPDHRTVSVKSRLPAPLFHDPLPYFLIQCSHLFADPFGLRLQAWMIPEDGVLQNDVAELRENDKYPVQQFGPMSFVNDLIGYHGN